MTTARNHISVSLIFVVACSVSGCVQSDEHDSSKAIKQEFKIKAGTNIAEQGDFVGAVRVFDEAMTETFINSESDLSGPLHSKAKALRELGRYEEALKTLEKFRTVNNVQDPTELEHEINALKAYAETGDDKLVRENIKWVMDTYQNILPPVNWVFHSPTYISKILRLYDTIGDHDAGIAYIDMVLNFFRSGKAGDPKPGRVDAEFMIVREAFEQDKRDGSKGRATQAIIKSKYFTW